MLQLHVQMPEKVAIETDPDGKDWRRALKKGFEAMARLWRDKFLNRHFKAEAKGKYHYQPRTRGYMIRKMKLAQVGKVRDGGLVDLVFTGLLREFVTGTVRISATAEGATARMQGPKYLWMVPKNNRQPDKAKEILEMADDEILEENELAQSTVVKEFY